jgi:SAM-dependent methyltransferase
VGLLATSALTFSKRLLGQALGPGGLAVDATAGNGHDAVFLAGLVGEAGVVHCFDIQAEALERTRALLAAAGRAGVARFHAVGHEDLLAALPEEHHGRIRAVVFNLGYRPGGDPAVATRPETTLAALGAALRVLGPGGVVSVVCYTGHAGGADEARAVEAFCQDLDFTAWRAARYELANKPGPAIRLFFIEKHG